LENIFSPSDLHKGKGIPEEKLGAFIWLVDWFCFYIPEAPYVKFYNLYDEIYQSQTFVWVKNYSLHFD
jgi:hypothetical protein